MIEIDNKLLEEVKAGEVLDVVNGMSGGNCQDCKLQEANLLKITNKIQFGR